jgi:hypothetical protein
MKTGKKRTVWFSKEQEEVLQKILDLTGRETNVSNAIRDGLVLKLEQLKKAKSKMKV